VSATSPSPQAPLADGFAERLIGSIRRGIVSAPVLGGLHHHLVFSTHSRLSGLAVTSTTPMINSASKPARPDSASVGTSGGAGERGGYNFSLRTLKALTGWWKPLRTSSPASSASASVSTAVCTLASTRIWPFCAASHRRQARFATLPV